MKRTRVALVFIIFIIFQCEMSKDPISNQVSKYTNLDWYRIHVDEDSIWSYSIHFSDSKNGWIVGDGGRILNTNDGGFTWDIQKSGVHADLRCVFFIDDRTGWACGSNSCILKTVDGGNTWKNVYEDENSKKLFTDIQFADGSRGWAVNNYGEIIHSNDGGESWNIQYSWAIGGTALLSVIDRNTVYSIPYIGDYMLKSLDAGQSWLAVTMNDKPRWQTAMFFLNQTHGWLTSMVAPSSMMESESPIFHTNDGGNTWTRQDSLSDNNLTSVWFVNENIGWVSGWWSIFYSENGGWDWEIQYSPDSLHVNFKDLYFINEGLGWALDWRGSVYKYFKE